MNSIVAEDGTGGGDFTEGLQAGTTLLRGQYVIEGFLNSGGFGMTYLAKDSLERTVVIKECFPAAVCTRTKNSVRARSRAQHDDFRSIVRLFLQEARQLAKLDHPHIVGVHQVFEDNDTAYMALDFIDGLDFLDIIEDSARVISPDQLRAILLKILAAVGFMHEQNILHRDISPDNILLDPEGDPVLIDFGAARQKASKASRALSALLVVKDGYSPQEFYVAGADQGPFSDLYALAATMHHIVVGKPPPNSQSRLAVVAEGREDPYQPIANKVDGFDLDFLASIDKALNLFPKDRFQSADEWTLEIDLEKRIEHDLNVAGQDVEIDISISQLVSETNIAVQEEVRRISREPEQVAAPAPVSKLREKFAEIAREIALDAQEQAEQALFDEAEALATANSPDASDDAVQAEAPDDADFADGDFATEEMDDPSSAIAKIVEEDTGEELLDYDQEYMQDERGLDQGSWIFRVLIRWPIGRLLKAFKKTRTDNLGKAG